MDGREELVQRVEVECVGFSESFILVFLFNLIFALFGAMWGGECHLRRWGGVGWGRVRCQEWGC